MTLEEFAKQYWAYQGQRLREATIVGYESTWSLYVGPAFGAIEIADIDRRMVEEWLAGFEHPGAAHKAWALLRGMLKKAVRWDILETDRLVGGVELPRVPRYNPPILTPRELRRTLRGFLYHPLEAWLLVASGCALRTEEGLYVNADESIDLRAGTVHVCGGLQWVNGRTIEVPPKTELSDRILPMPHYVTKRLRELHPHGRLIGDLTPLQVSRQYKAWCAKQKLPYVPAKNLRTSWATMALEAGVDISIVAKFLGHSDIATTARYYLRPELAALRDAQKIFEKTIIN